MLDVSIEKLNQYVCEYKARVRVSEKFVLAYTQYKCIYYPRSRDF